MRLDINIAAGLPSPGDDGFQGAQLGSQMGHLLARMEFDYPTQMLAVVKVNNGDGTYDCHRPGTNIYMSRVETISAVLAQRISVGMTVLIRFFRRDRNKPYIVRIGGLALFSGALAWPAYRSDFSRGNQLAGNYSAGTPAGSALSVDDPIQWRHSNGTTYAWRETAATFYLKSVDAEGASVQVELDKAWHDIILSGDYVVGMNSAATSGLTGGLPVHFVHTTGQICVECRSASTLALIWQACLATFDIEVDDPDGGIGVG